MLELEAINKESSVVGIDPAASGRIITTEPVSEDALSANLEQPVYEADLIVDASLAGETVSASDNPHDLEALDRGCRRLHRLEPRVSRMTS